MTQPTWSAEQVEAAKKLIQGYRASGMNTDADFWENILAASIPATGGAETPKRWLVEEHLPSGVIRWQVTEHEYHANDIAAGTEFPTHTVVTPLFAASPAPLPTPKPAQETVGGGEPVAWFIPPDQDGVYQQVAKQHYGEPDLVPLYALPQDLASRVEKLEEALSDLVSWFDGGPTNYGPYIIKAGEHGADDAVTAARAALVKP